MARMDYSPHAFIKDHAAKDLKQLKGFRHRTFNEDDLYYFVESLQQLYSKNHSLEKAFFPTKNLTTEQGLIHFRNYFFSQERREHFIRQRRLGFREILEQFGRSVGNFLSISKQAHRPETHMWILVAQKVGWRTVI